MINNLTAHSKDRIKRGDMVHLKEVLVEELEEQKTFLVNSNEIGFKIVQGQCRSLERIIKLLP